MKYKYKNKEYQGSRGEIQDQINADLRQVPLKYLDGKWYLDCEIIKYNGETPDQATDKLVFQAIKNVPVVSYSLNNNILTINTLFFGGGEKIKYVYLNQEY